MILGAPYVGQLRAAIRSAYPGQFKMIVGSAIALAVAAAMMAAVARIRERRAVRYTLLVAALVVGTSFAYVHASGDGEVDVVERFHFVEYGLLALLLYRFWRQSNDGSTFILPMLAGLLVGTLDEWFQWFIPSRVGEMRDVALDAVAVACGLCFSAAVDPPARISMALPPRSIRRVGAGAAITLVVFALFFETVHLGYEISDQEIGVFRSRYTRAELEGAAKDRSERWHAHLPVFSSQIAREDQYLSEGFWHVRRRNQAWAEGDLFASWRENRILEKFFAPVLDGSYAPAASQRWSPEQHADAADRADAANRSYASTANPYPIYAWSKPVFWTMTAAVTLLILTLTIACSRRPLDA